MAPSLGIDASNITSGGGLTHLIEFLSHINSDDLKFLSVHVWCLPSISRFLPKRTWLFVHVLKHPTYLHRIFWHIFQLPTIARHLCCTVVFFPGCFNLTFCRKSVVLSQNMLPFAFSLCSRVQALGPCVLPSVP